MEAIAKSIAQGIRNSPALYKMVRPVAERYVEYISPNQYVFAIYERVDWQDVETDEDSAA